MLAAIRRCGSLVEFSLMTVNATCPGLMCFRPSLREISLQLGGKMEETRTMLHAAIPALRKASSKLESRSRCLPTPFVRKIFFATNAMSGAGVRCPLISADSKRSAHPSCAKNSREKLLRVRKSNKNTSPCQSISHAHAKSVYFSIKKPLKAFAGLLHRAKLQEL